MKIALVRRGFSSTGGAEAYLVRLANGLVRAGHEVILVTSGSWPTAVWKLGVVVTLDGDSPEVFAKAFAALSRDWDVTFTLDRVPGCDVFRAGDGVHAAWLERRAPYEPRWRVWTRFVNGKHRELCRLERAIFDPANTGAVIANSRMVADEISARFAFPPDRLHVVYNGISSAVPTMDRSEARRRVGVDEAAYVALFVGSGWDRKGLRFAIDAVERVAGTTLLVAGRGPAADYASPAVKFLGPLNDLTALFSAADIFVLPTIYDPFSNACLEALAAGLPVLTTPANGCSEILGPGLHGDIAPVGDSRALAAHIASWRDPARREKSRSACRALAQAHSIDRNVAETIQILATARTTG